MSKFLESTSLNKSRFPKYKMASLNVDHIPSDIWLFIPEGVSAWFWRFKAVRKCSTASLCCEEYN